MKNVNIMDTIAPNPPFDPRTKNHSVEFHPVLKVDTNKYMPIFQHGIYRTKYKLDNKMLGVRTDGTELTENEMNLKINIDNPQ